MPMHSASDSNNDKPPSPVKSFNQSSAIGLALSVQNPKIQKVPKNPSPADTSLPGSEVSSSSPNTSTTSGSNSNSPNRNHVVVAKTSSRAALSLKDEGYTSAANTFGKSKASLISDGMQSSGDSAFRPTFNTFRQFPSPSKLSHTQTYSYDNSQGDTMAAPSKNKGKQKQALDEFHSHSYHHTTNPDQIEQINEPHILASHSSTSLDIPALVDSSGMQRTYNSTRTFGLLADNDQEYQQHDNSPDPLDVSVSTRDRLNSTNSRSDSSPKSLGKESVCSTNSFGIGEKGGDEFINPLQRTLTPEQMLQRQKWEQLQSTHSRVSSPTASKQSHYASIPANHPERSDSFRRIRSKSLSIPLSVAADKEFVQPPRRLSSVNNERSNGLDRPQPNKPYATNQALSPNANPSSQRGPVLWQTDPIASPRTRRVSLCTTLERQTSHAKRLSSGARSLHQSRPNSRFSHRSLNSNAEHSSWPSVLVSQQRARLQHHLNQVYMSRPRFSNMSAESQQRLQYDSVFPRLCHIVSPLFVFAHIPITVFLDYNALFCLVQVALNPENTQSATKVAWWVGVGLYSTCSLFWFFGIVIVYEWLWCYKRRWSVDSPFVLPIYLSNPGHSMTAIKSYTFYSLLYKTRFSASARDFLIESCWLYAQNWPTVVTLLPRGILTLILLILYWPYGPDLSTAGQRDPSYFSEETGRLTTYALVVLIVNAGWAAYRLGVVVLASLGLFFSIGWRALYDREKDKHALADVDSSSLVRNSRETTLKHSDTEAGTDLFDGLIQTHDIGNLPKWAWKSRAEDRIRSILIQANVSHSDLLAPKDDQIIKTWISQKDAEQAEPRSPAEKLQPIDVGSPLHWPQNSEPIPLTGTKVNSSNELPSLLLIPSDPRQTGTGEARRMQHSVSPLMDSPWLKSIKKGSPLLTVENITSIVNDAGGQPGSMASAKHSLDPSPRPTGEENVWTTPELQSHSGDPTQGNEGHLSGSAVKMTGKKSANSPPSVSAAYQWYNNRKRSSDPSPKTDSGSPIGLGLDTGLNFGQDEAGHASSPYHQGTGVNRKSSSFSSLASSILALRKKSGSRPNSQGEGDGSPPDSQGNKNIHLLQPEAAEGGDRWYSFMRRPKSKADKDPLEKEGSQLEEKGTPETAGSPTHGRGIDERFGSQGTIVNNAATLSHQASPSTGSPQFGLGSVETVKTLLERPLSPASHKSGESSETDDSEEKRLWASFPDQSRKFPPGLIALSLEQQALAAMQTSSAGPFATIGPSLLDAFENIRTGTEDVTPMFPVTETLSASLQNLSSSASNLLIGSSSSNNSGNANLYMTPAELSKSPSQGGLTAIREESWSSSLDSAAPDRLQSRDGHRSSLNASETQSVYLSID